MQRAQIWANLSATCCAFLIEHMCDNQVPACSPRILCTHPTAGVQLKDLWPVCYRTAMQYRVFRWQDETARLAEPYRNARLSYRVPNCKSQWALKVTMHVYRTRKAQMVASQCMQHHDQRAWHVQTAPGADEVVWDNLKCVACPVHEWLQSTLLSLMIKCERCLQRALRPVPSLQAVHVSESW